LRIERSATNLGRLGAGALLPAFAAIRDRRSVNVGGRAADAAKTVVSALGLSLATASHHVRSLRGRGLLAQVGNKRQVRGAVQTFYALSEKAKANASAEAEYRIGP
jgi:DNA-binding transcriptional ArsR family regulator